MSTLIVASLIGACVGAVLLAFVLMLLDNGRLRSDVARLKEQRNTAMDAKRAAEASLTDVARQLDQARRELDNSARARNPLYREAMEDQRARQLNAAADVATGVEFMVQAIRTLNPELLKEKKG